MKKLSIVIINYNDKQRVGRAIESALNQSYKNVEVIVVDDGSTEDVRKLYDKYKGNIKLVQLERTDLKARTVPQALNEGIKACTGDYIAVLGSDNYYNKDFAKETMKFDNDVVFCNWKIIGLTEYEVNIEKIWDFKNRSLMENYLAQTHLDHQAFIIKRSVQMEVGLYDERFPRSQDAEMIVRIMKHTIDWHHVQQQLFYFEHHEKEQYKNVGSIYGKTLWALKHGLNLEFVINKIRSHPLLIFTMCKAINDFNDLDIWQGDKNNSIYKEIYDKHIDLINKDLTE